MQLSRKTLETTLSVIKVKVTPSDHPFKKTDSFGRASGFKISLWKPLLPLKTWPRKQQKSVYSISMFLMQSRLLEQLLIACSPKKTKQVQKKTSTMAYLIKTTYSYNRDRRKSAK